MHGRIKKIIEKKETVFIICFHLFVFMLTALSCTPREFTDDDWGIANYFAGAMGGGGVCDSV